MSDNEISSRIFVRYGIAAGVIGALYLLIPEILNLEIGPWYTYMYYAFLVVILFYGLRRYRSKHDVRFQKGLMFGIKLSIVAAVIIAVLNLIVFAIDPESSIDKFNVHPASLTEVFGITFWIFIEVIVFGLIISFIFMQLYKNDPGPTNMQQPAGS